MEACIFNLYLILFKEACILNVKLGDLLSTEFIVKYNNFIEEL